MKNLNFFIFDHCNNLQKDTSRFFYKSQTESPLE